MTEKKRFTRRQALETLGKTAAAALVTTVALNTDAHAEPKAESNVQSIIFTVGSYSAHIHSAPQYSWESRIIMRSNPAKYTFDVFFIKEEYAVPANVFDPHYAKVYFPASRYMEVRDFLRYESPVVVILASNGIATITTGEYELVGDHDI